MDIIPISPKNLFFLYKCTEYAVPCTFQKMAMHVIEYTYTILMWWCVLILSDPSSSTAESTADEESKEKADAMPNISDIMLRKLKLHRGLPGWWALHTLWNLILLPSVSIEPQSKSPRPLFQCPASYWERSRGGCLIISFPTVVGQQYCWIQISINTQVIL